MISLLLLPLMQSPSAIGPDDLVARAINSYLIFKVTLPSYKVDESGMRTLRGDERRPGAGDRLLFYGHLKGRDDATVKVLSGTGKLSGAGWRKGLLNKEFVGAGLFDLGNIACSENLSFLNPPYQRTSWHGFPVVGDTCIDIHIWTVAKPDDMPVTRAEFEAIVKGMRFAIFNHGEWTEVPQRYLDLSHEACMQADGVAWLRKQIASAAADEPLARLALGEHLLAASAPPEEALKAFDDALAAFALVPKPTKELSFARALALDGAGVALVLAGKASDGIPRIEQARELAVNSSANALIGFAHDLGVAHYRLAVAHAADKDTTNVVKSLKAAFELDQSLRAMASQDKAFEALRGEKMFADLVPLPQK